MMVATAVHRNPVLTGGIADLSAGGRVGLVALQDPSQDPFPRPTAQPPEGQGKGALSFCCGPSYVDSHTSVSPPSLHAPVCCSVFASLASRATSWRMRDSRVREDRRRHVEGTMGSGTKRHRRQRQTDTETESKT